MCPVQMLPTEKIWVNLALPPKIPIEGEYKLLPEVLGINKDLLCI